MFCSDPMSGSNFIVQTSKFLLIDATAVTERSPSTFPQTHIFLVPNIYGLAQTVLTWEAKFLAAAGVAAAETNWKHKVTPDWGDLIMDVRVLTGLVWPAARPPARATTIPQSP